MQGLTPQILFSFFFVSEDLSKSCNCITYSVYTWLYHAVCHLYSLITVTCGQAVVPFSPVCQQWTGRKMVISHPVQVSFPLGSVHRKVATTLSISLFYGYATRCPPCRSQVRVLNAKTLGVGAATRVNPPAGNCPDYRRCPDRCRDYSANLILFLLCLGRLVKVL